MLFISFLTPILACTYPIYDEDAPLQNFPEEEVFKEEQESRGNTIKKQKQRNGGKLALESFPSDLEKKRSFISKHEPHKRSREFSSHSKRHRQSPSRPRVTHCDPKKKPNQQIEDENQEGFSVYQEKEQKEMSEIPEQEAVKSIE